jgi:hypothetical protein
MYLAGLTGLIDEISKGKENGETVPLMLFIIYYSEF